MLSINYFKLSSSRDNKTRTYNWYEREYGLLLMRRFITLSRTNFLGIATVHIFLQSGDRKVVIAA